MYLVSLMLRGAALLVTAWCAGMLYFTLPKIGGFASLAMLMVGLIALPHLRMRRQIRLLWGVAVVSCFLWWRGIAPSNDRVWKPSVAVLPYAEIHGDDVYLHNIRNFHYRSENDFDRNYYDKHFNLNELSGVDVYTSYWSSDYIAHIMVSFAFAERDFIAFSIETRNEAAESYSTMGGFFKQYELTFVAADERDVIGLRTTYRQPPEKVYIFRTATRLDNARRLFLSYLDRINQLHARAEFYNTLLTNCSTSVMLCTQSFPNKIPITWQVFVSGFFPEYLYGLGTLDSRYALEELKELGLVNRRSESAGYADDYSLQIRAGVPRQEPKR